MEYIDLVTDNGELVRIELPLKHVDNFWDAYRGCVRRKDTFSIGQFSGSKMTFMNLQIATIDTQKIIGEL